MDEAPLPRVELFGLLEYDVRDLLWGSVLNAVSSVAFATACLYLARTRDDPRVGPTAASLNDGLSRFFGADGHRAPRVLVAYIGVLVPLLVLTRPSDMGVGEAQTTALGLGALVAA